MKLVGSTCRNGNGICVSHKSLSLRSVRPNPRVLVRANEGKHMYISTWITSQDMRRNAQAGLCRSFACAHFLLLDSTDLFDQHTYLYIKCMHNHLFWIVSEIELLCRTIVLTEQTQTSTHISLSAFFLHLHINSAKDWSWKGEGGWVL